MSKKNPLDKMVEESQNMGFYDTPEDKIVRVLDKGFVRLIDHMGSDSAIVQAARVSYGEGTKKINEDRGLIRYLLRNKHTTPFEMVQFKFHIKAPIFVFRQWHRHRMWSYNEYSGRYSEMKDEFYVPDDSVFTAQNPHNKQGGSDEVITLSSSKNIDDWVEWQCFGDTREEGAKAYEPFLWSKEFEQEQSMSRYYYERWLGTGVRKELARINLPLSQYSEMYASVDLHNLFHFLKLRMDSHAQYEIRVYADAIGKLIKDIIPIAYEAFEDYIVTGTFFSGKDLNALSELLNSLTLENNTLDEVATKHFENKREKQEFVDKCKKLLNK